MRLALAVVLGIGLAVGAALWSAPGGRAPRDGPAEPLRDERGPTAPPAASAVELELLRAEVAMLADRIGDLEAELELLRSALERRPAEEPAAAATGARPSAAERQAALTALEQAREALAARRAAERAEREERMISERARRIAAELELDPVAEARLAECLAAEAQELRALLERWSAGEADRGLLGAEFLALRDAGAERLRGAFGPELAARILRAEREGRGRLPNPSGPPPGAPEEGG
jgi:hypothetical protein